MNTRRSVAIVSLASVLLFAGARIWAEQKPAPAPTNPGQPSGTLPATPTYTAPGKLTAAPAAEPTPAVGATTSPDALTTSPTSSPSIAAAVPHLNGVTHAGSLPNPTVAGQIKCTCNATLTAFYSKKVGSTWTAPAPFQTFQCKPCAPSAAGGPVVVVTQSATFTPAGGVSPGDKFAFSVKEGSAFSNVVVHTF